MRTPLRAVRLASSRLITVALMLAAALLSAGCGTLPKPPPAEVREQLDRVAVVVVPGGPRTDFHTFATSRSEGTAKGAALGASQGVMEALAQGAASGGGGAYAGVATAIAVMILAMVGGLVGAVSGHQQAVPSDVSAQVETRVEESVARLALGDLLGARLLESAAARAELRSKRLVLYDSATAAPELPALREQGIDSVLLLEVREAGFEGGSGGNPLIHLYVTAHLRLTRVADGGTAYERDFRHSGQEQTFGHWFAEGSVELERAFGLAIDDLAGRVLDEMYLVTEFPFGSGLWALPSSEYYGTCWLKPVYPPHHIKPFGRFLWENMTTPGRAASESIRDMIQYETVNSRQPLLRWEEFPRPRDRVPGNDAILQSIGNVTYDIRIWEAPTGYPERLVYDIRDLQQPQYRPGRTLRPGTRYFWTFRARYTLGSRPQATRWAYSPVPATAPGMPGGGSCDMDQIPSSNYYRFATP